MTVTGKGRPEAEDIDWQCGQIIAALPETFRADAVAMADTDSFLAYCAGSILAAHHIESVGVDWPYTLLIDRLRNLSLGFGDWLDAIGAAIDAALIEDIDREGWRIAHAATKGLVMTYHVRQGSADWPTSHPANVEYEKQKNSSATKTIQLGSTN